ncbi:MAG: gliding motility-associated C-terminal domain-containing protein [Bacteroidales bacterium]|nr:gliding motility-associated C-terminal domain-containing protein [Bacteroidales bacterium]
MNLTAITPGGIWSGTGITDAILGTFDPATAGSGDFTIFYDLTNGACTEQGSINIHVDNDVDATITLVAPVCESDAAFDFVAADLGGVWSGTGITNPANGTFDPAIAGVGFHTIDYNITNGVCSDSDSFIIEVSSEPNATVNAAGPFCESDAPVNLTATTPGGTWSGTGITDAVNGTFDPSVSGSGDFTIFYDLTNGACNEQGSINIHVDNDVDATITPVAPVCESDAAFDFVAADPGGIWSGTGITNPANGTFDPAIAGVGFHTIDYNISNGVCSDSDSFIIEVSAEPDATVNAAGPFCESDAPVNLTATTPGGIWSGTGITDAILGTFDPATAGGGDFTIFYDLTNGACTEQGTITIHVDDEVDATITPAGPFCQFDTPVNLTAVSSGGIWSGSGITDINLGTFNPTVAGVGTFTITYNVVNGLCSDSDNTDIDVLLAPDGTINDPGEFCSDDLPVNLTAATPGGVWSGTGITNAVNGTFDPSVANDGANNILYTVSNADCTTIGSITIYVYDAAVDATITTTGPYCISDGLITLAAVSSGGIWSGVGIIDPVNGTFDPNVAGIGAHAITYDVGNPACFDTDTQMIQVDDSLSAIITPVATLCENTAPFNFSAADAGGTWSGTGITDPILGTFNPSTAGDGTHVITYTIISGACTNIDTFDMSVDASVTATITAAGPFCENDAIQTLISADAGGTWSGAGIVNPATGQFHPNVAGPGDHAIQYDIVNGTCSDSDTETIHIDALPNTTITPVGPYCENDAAINLVAATGGGTWSGTGITDAVLGTFNPSTAGGGNHLITYELTVGACTNSSNTNIQVDDFYDATITPAGPFCDNSSATTLTAASTGGTWSGTGITNPANGTFHPGVSGEGDFVIQYQITNGTCSDTDNITIHVDEYQNTTITPAGPFCEDAVSVNLTAATPGGTWSGNGITDAILGTFDPATAGNGNHLIGYEITNGACSSSSSITIQVDELYDATITPAGPFCDNGSATTLTAASSGGTWSGTGITNPANGTFHPGVSGEGDFVIQYQITNGLCSDTDNITIHVDEYQNTTITPAGPFCEDAVSVNLTAATPGGTWSGNGITDAILGTFDPATAGNGNHLIGYEITNGACTSSSSTTIQVDDFLDATITPAGPFCDNGAATTLTAASTGGTWSGTGITNPANGTFHPGVSGDGDFVIQYQITNGLCSDTDNITIHVDEYLNTTITPAGPFCEDAASVNLTAATLGGTWSGNGITDAILGTFDPATAGNGNHLIGYEITNGACTSSSSITIQVDDFLDATITPAGPYCNNGSAVTLTAATLGGTWSGTGITNPANGTFHPGIAGPGDFVIDYQITNGLCSDSDNITIHVDEYFDASILAISDFCETDAIVDLTSLNPGGTWSGNGIIVPANGTFDPSGAGAGDHIITYEITTGACYSSDSETVHVDAQPDPTITPAGPLCANEPSFDLTAAQTGGQWSGVGITNTTNGTFNASVAGAGDHVITYEIINGVCSANDTEIIHVDSNPNTVLSTVGPFCETDAAVDLVEPSPGGTWSGTGITNITTGIFDPAFATDGTYLITYTNINGACVSSGTTNITVDALVDATITDVGPFCETDASVVLTAVSPGGNWAGPGIVNPVTGVFNPLNAGVGNHTITYSVANGVCSDTDDTQITVEDSPEVNILTTGPFCENEGNQLFVADVAGGVWSGNGIDMTGNFSPSTAGDGIHPISYTLSSGSCVVVETENITVDQFVDAEITSTGPFCFNDTPDYLTSLNPGGVWSGDGISFDGLFSPAGAGVGTHTITYEITNGACFDDDTQDLLVKSNPDPTISGPWDVCENEPPFNYTAATSGGLWSGTGFTDVVAGTFSPQLSGVGGFLIVYQVTVDGCSSIDFDTLNVHELPVVTISGLNSDYCINDEAVLVNVSPSGGVLSGGNIVGTLFDPEVAGVGTHLIEYVYSDANSCSNTASFTVEVHDIPTVSISGIDPTYCIYEDTVYPALLPIGGTFEGPGTFNDVGFVPALAGPGDFELIYHFTDIFGCSDTSYVSTTVFDYANIEFESTQTQCFGDSTGSAIATVTGYDPFDYLWSDYTSSMTNEISNVPSGWYYLSVTDDNLCITIDSVFVEQPPQLIVDIVSSVNASCYGFEDASVLASATGGTPDYEFLWNNFPPSDTSFIDSLPVGTYIVTVTDANMCTATDTAFITEPDTLSLSFIDIFNVSCYGNSDGSVTVEPQGGTEPYTAFWNDDSSTIGLTVENLEAGYYTVTVIDENDCQISDSVLITQPAPIYIEIDITPVICNQQTGSIQINAFGGTEPYDYLWSTGDTLPLLPNVLSQEYTVTIQDANGCMIDTTLFVPSEGGLTTIITQTEYNLCYGDKIAELVAHTTLAAMPVYYDWSNYILDSVNPNLPAGDYSVTITDFWGCFGIDSITVSEPELLVAEVSSINILCKGELSGVANVEITGGTPDYDIEWHTGDTGYTLGNLGPGEASVIVTDANNCRTSGSSFITEPETGMVVNFNIKHVTCNGAEDGAINAFATGGNPPYWYTWFINGVEINEPSIRNLDGGFYTLQVSDNFGCITDTIIQIYEVNTLIANTEVGATSCIGNHDGYIAVIAGGGTPPYSYYLMDMLWDSYIIDSLYRGDYYITVRDSNDCELNLGPIFVPDTEIDCLRIPAAFSPNGDGHNDEFYIENIHLYPRSMVQIYNRWGQLLYEDRGINGFWDGTYNGNPVPTGAYLYHIMLNIDEDPRIGTVTVVR